MLALSKGVYSKDDCGRLTSKVSNPKRCSKQNTYHVVNKNIAPSKVTDGSRRKRGCLPGHPQALALWCPQIILGVPWASPSLGSCHSLFHNPSNLFTQNLKTSQHKSQNRKLVSSVSERKQKTTSRYCNEQIIYLYVCYTYCIPTSLWFINYFTSHRFIKISKQPTKNRICEKQNSLQ